MFPQKSPSELEMFGVKINVKDSILICENLENSAKILSIIESEHSKARYGIITHKCILKKKEIKYFNLYIHKSKLDIEITDYYGNDGNGNLKSISLNWTLKEQKSEQE